MLSSIKVEDDNTDPCKLDNMDPSLFMATLAAWESKSLLPILKEELKLKIQTNRMAAGKEELPKPIFKEPEKFELTEEEKLRRNIRKERNRIAAAKCRNKRKVRKEHDKTILAELELKNFTLKRKVEDLEQEKEIVITKLRSIGKLTNIFEPTQSPPPSSVSHQIVSTTRLPLNQTSSCQLVIPETFQHSYHDVQNSNKCDKLVKVQPYPSSSTDNLPREMEYMNWVAPRCDQPRACSSTCTMDESWQDDLFDEVDGDLFNIDQYINDKPKTCTVTSVEEEHGTPPPRYFLPLVPVFEDEATVPGGVEDPTFQGRLTPTSPTFY